MDLISDAPFASIKDITECCKRLYKVTVHHWIHQRFDGSQQNENVYKPTPGDLLLLSDGAPETVSDLERYGRTYVLASITAVEEDGESTTKFEIKVSKDISETDDFDRSHYLIPLSNLISFSRVWKALAVGRPLGGNLHMIKAILSAKSRDENNCSNYCVTTKTNEKMADLVCSSELNESQVAAVENCARAIQCDKHHTTKLVWGPPGTGKTRTVAELLMILMRNHRVLSCTPTNVAALEISSRLLAAIKNRWRTVATCETLCPMGDIVLFGSMRRLKIPANSELFDIFLDHRVNVLVSCFAPLSGWNYQISSLTCFLEDCMLQYNLHLANENCKSDIGKKQEMDDCMFLNFFKKRFDALTGALRECTENLYVHLPTFLLSRVEADLIDLLKQLRNFDRLIYQSDITDEQLVAAIRSCVEVGDASQFSTELVEKPLSNVYRNMIEAWNLSLARLKSIKDSFAIPSFFDATAIRNFCLQSATLVFCTAVTSFKLVGIHAFDVLVIDEASQLKECESVIPLQISGIQNVILIGDECQLPAMVQSKVSEAAYFGRSLFERLSHTGHPYDLLKIQYRMHPSISSFPNRTFYSGMIEDAPNVRIKGYTKHYLAEKMYAPFSFINVADGREEIHENGHSMKNMTEVAVVLQIIKRLSKASCARKEGISVGLISPYAAQVTCIQEKINTLITDNSEFTVKVKSVDGFQGGEMDVVIISTVRSNLNGSIGFLASSQRANVALTRARYCLWVVGNAATLINSGSVWGSLVRNAEERCCFFNAADDVHLSKSIINVKKDLDQIDDLLNKDSVIFRNARWKVLFSDSFRWSFRKMKSISGKKITLNMLWKLAAGWRPRNVNVEARGATTPHLIQQYKVENLYIICTVDIMKYSEYTQVLKIWDILPLSDISKFTKRLENIFCMYTDDYMSHCKAKCIEGKLEIPMTWNRRIDIVQYKSVRPDNTTDVAIDNSLDGRNYAENSKVSESLLLMKFYSLSSGIVEHLLSNRDGKEVELPFEVTDQEREIIVFPCTSFILGRSGTGKTTILTMKLIQREQLFQLSSNGLYDSQTYSLLPKRKLHRLLGESDMEKENVLRQLFVTVSPKLCSAIKSHIRRLKSFTSGEENLALDMSHGMYEADDGINEFIDLPDCFMKIKPSQYPLVISFWKFLMMLDGSLGSSFFDRFEDLNELQVDERGYWRCPAFHAFLQQKEVTFERFALFYWPHFNSKLTKKLDCSVVFKEIISYIKGGLTCLDACDQVLGREAYVKLSGTRSSTLNDVERGTIFDIFLDYENMKCQHGDFDLSDFVVDIHHRLSKCGEFSFSMDFVYIDEVQDLTMRQISLFKYICNNFEEGFIFAGDTAQTIARGIDFRFQDVRSLFYTQFLMSSPIVSSCKSKDKVSSPVDFFHLTQNFRTHVGILKLAQSVVDLVYSFFPQSIDRLIPENSFIYGEAPILLESNAENAIITIFGSCGGKSGEDYSGFGAEQVILVRDSACKKEISAHVGKQALVLTIIECKGLEFQDVLLYNFFSSSPLKNQWRVIYGYMKTNHFLNFPNSVSFPCFEHSRHSILCSELKQLYVAITRTRQRLWICESEKEYSRPMFDYWKNLCLVQTRQLDDSLAQSMCVASSKDEWRHRGKKLYNEGNYEMATMCFERAGDLMLERLAKAAGLRDSGIRILDTNFEMARSALVEAAEIYEGIGKGESAAQCYIHLKDFKKAGVLYMEKCGISKLECAGDCFFQAGCWDQAAEIYARSNSVSKCLSACSKGQLFEKGLEFVENWKHDGPSCSASGNTDEDDEIKNTFLEKCALYYDRLKDKKNMMRFVKHFTSVGKVRDFLKSRGYLDELFLIEGELGNYEEAADIARIQGDLLSEASMLEKVGCYEDAAKLIFFHVVVNSLWALKNRGWPPISCTDKGYLIDKAKSLAEKSSAAFHQAASVEACVLAAPTDNLKVLVDCLCKATAAKHFRAETFAARKVLDIHLNSDPSKSAWTIDTCNQTSTSKDDLLHGKLSLKLLIFTWSIWKDNINHVLSYLRSTESSNYDCYVDCESFCYEYFGVRKLGSGKCVILNHEASWIKELGCPSFSRTGNLMYIETRHLLSSAIKYWSSELQNVALNILKKLDTLYQLLEGKADGQFLQGTTLLQIFDVSKFLMENPATNAALDTEAQNFVSQSVTRFRNILFPLEQRKASNKGVIALRSNHLALQMQSLLLEKSINMLRKGPTSGKIGRLTSGKIGRFVTILFGTIVDIGEDKYLTIVKEFEHFPVWKDFIEKLQQNNRSSLREISFLDAFRDALQSTFYVDWSLEPDYISPTNFLYLVERLLFLALSCQGSYFTTRSYLVEAMNGPQSGASGVLLAANTYAPQQSLMPCFHFVMRVTNSLLSSDQGTRQWIKKSRINDDRWYYRHLVSRAVTMTGLICLNTGIRLNSLVELLSLAKRSKDLLPPFFKWLANVNRDNFILNFANALNDSGDPLVAVGFKDGALPSLSGLSGIVMRLESKQERDVMLNILFPESPNPTSLLSAPSSSSEGPCSSVLPQCSATDMTINISKNLLTEGHSCSSVVPWGIGDSMDDSKDLGNEVSASSRNDDCGVKLKEIYHKLWPLLEQCLSALDHDNWEEAGERSALASRVKDDIRETTVMLETLLDSIHNEKSAEISLQRAMVEESCAVHDELKKLSTILSTSDDGGQKVDTAEQIVEALRARKPRQLLLLDSLSLGSETEQIPDQAPGASANAKTEGKDKPINKANYSKKNKKKGKGGKGKKR